MTYTYEQSAAQPGALATDPIPEIGLVDCSSRDQWAELLWELNQPDEGGRSRATILIHDAKDLLRLQRAIAGRRIVQLNGDEASSFPSDPPAELESAAHPTVSVRKPTARSAATLCWQKRNFVHLNPRWVRREWPGYERSPAFGRS